jgi:nucleoside-diphosphate-sugar epimerase
VRTLGYSRDKVQVEDMLAVFERRHPQMRIVRLRPCLMARPGAARHLMALFAGPLIPRFVVAHPPLVPRSPRLRFQLLHTRDVARAFHLALHSDVRGAFNIAAEQELDGRVIAKALGRPSVRVPEPLLRLLASIAWHLRIVRADPAWIDLALGTPLLDSTRARRELGWSESVEPIDALIETLQGIGQGAQGPTPALHEGDGDPAHMR